MLAARGVCVTSMPWLRTCRCTCRSFFWLRALCLLKRSAFVMCVRVRLHVGMCHDFVPGGCRPEHHMQIIIHMLACDSAVMPPLAQHRPSWQAPSAL
jgi:hypothetical protein